MVELVPVLAPRTDAQVLQNTRRVGERLQLLSNLERDADALPLCLGRQVDTRVQVQRARLSPTSPQLQ